MKGIIFDAESVAAILRGDKTQTRRIVKPQPIHTENGWYEWGWNMGAPKASSPKRCFWHGDTWKPSAPIDEYARFQPGDVVYVRETHTYADAGGFRVLGQYVSDAVMVDYRADAAQLVVGVDEDVADQVSAWIADREVDGNGDNWRSPIHMPEWAARIHLEIIGVRVERLQDISESDAKAEAPDSHVSYKDARGLCTENPRDYLLAAAAWRNAFCERWNDINAKRAPWESNPWVWVYEFRRVEQ